MKTRCRRCRKIIDFGNRLCDECHRAIIKENKKGLKNKDVEKTTKSAKWKAVRRKVILRDKCCVMCLSDKYVNAKNLQVHHIIKRKDNEDLIYEMSNLVTLCRDCHEKAEKMSIEDQKRIFNKYINKEVVEFRL